MDGGNSVFQNGSFDFLLHNSVTFKFFADKESPELQAFLKENREYREALFKSRRMQQKNMDLRSLRGSAILKLDQAEKFKDFERIYFPYNLDFRGRACEL